MRAVITVIGRDAVGIIANTSAILSRSNINILDINQSVYTDIFAMVMFVDISNSSVPFAQLQKELDEEGRRLGVAIHAMHEDIFRAMHEI
jgi:ACT domain-containing protein